MVYHMIRLKEETVKRLKKFGKFGESYDDLINKILDRLEELKKK